MSEVTFVIPIGLRHLELSERAIASAQAQTIPVEILTMVDNAGEGPGVLRNEMLRQVTTEFVSFLDADDWIEPTFAEETIAEYRRIGGNKYIFTDWFTDNGVINEAPMWHHDIMKAPVSKPGVHPYCGGTWHVITTLIPTQWARDIGGFDEILPAVEDTAFYMELCATKHCGHHLGRSLFHYSAAGERGKRLVGTIALDQIMADLTKRNAGRMGCCGDDQRVEPPIGAKQPGDVVARAKWIGKRSVHGRASGRHYPNISAVAMQNTAWVDPRDVQLSPDLWEIVEMSANEPPSQPMNLRQMGQIVLSNVKKSPYAPPQNEPPVPQVIQGERNVRRIVSLAKKAAGIEDEFILTPPPSFELTNLQWDVASNIVSGSQNSDVVKVPTKNFVPIRDHGDPIFVFADKDYPSYTDIKRLVALSGFRSMPLSKVDVFSKAPLIVVSPEPIGDRFRGVPARVICWQLEYAGEYINNYAEFGGEIWGSDKAWCEQHDAKYVLMGSHEGLCQSPLLHGEKAFYDITMLAYMTPRRQFIQAKLGDLRWPVDYPGHGTADRDTVLSSTNLMLHVHQHDNAPFVAPQRFAIAAAYHMPIVSEAIIHAGDLGDGVVTYAHYADIPDMVKVILEHPVRKEGNVLHNLLCIERPFRRCVEEALK